MALSDILHKFEWQSYLRHSNLRYILCGVAIVVLFAVFSVVGLSIHSACKEAPRNQHNWVDIAGYDSEAYITHYTLPVGLCEVNHRHPLIAAANAPITVVGMMFTNHLGREAGFRAVICMFALLGALTCGLLWLVLFKSGGSHLSRFAAMALWLSFGHVWLLAGIAETFSISMAIMLGVLLMVLCKVRDIRAWLGACVLAGGVTVTNVVKPLVAWMVAADGLNCIRKLPRRTILRGVIVLAALLFAGLTFVCCKWTFLDGYGVMTGFEICCNEIVKAIPQDFSLGHRMWCGWNAFWCEPMMLRESVISQGPILHDYATAVPHVIGAIVLMLCVWSAIRNFKLSVVRAALAMVAFDFMLHLVIGWGIEEGQIYCGHWFWIVPLLVSLLPRPASLLTILLSISIAIHNLICVL